MHANTLRSSEMTRATPGPPAHPNKKRGKHLPPPVRSKITLTKDNQSLRRSELDKGNSFANKCKVDNKKKAGFNSTGLTLKGLNVVPLKRAGEYRLGPKQGSSPVKCIEHYLARKDGTDEFYVIKILTRKSEGEKETIDDIQGKTLIQTEHSLLSLLRNETGVIHEHGLFNETIQEPFVNKKRKVTTKEVRRVCLVVDCFTSHDFSPKYGQITNMQLYVIREKRLKEAEAIRVFFKVVTVVERLHKLNIVHRDLKLGNIILNQETKEITLTNFCLAKHLVTEEEPLKDQRGSPAYVSPEVLCGTPYLGKSSDVWSLGVVLYTMIYGQFPFYDDVPAQLFRKIKLGEFNLPPDVNVSQKTINLIKSLLHLDPKKRPTASATLDKVKSIIAEERDFLSDSNLQIVPDCPPGQPGRPVKRKCDCSTLEGTLEMFTEIAISILEAKSGLELSPTLEIDALRQKCKKSNVANLERLQYYLQKQSAQVSPPTNTDGSTSFDDDQLVPAVIPKS